MRTLPLACRSGWLPFNSFEDETNLWKEIRLHNKRVLSIPLRMKQILRLCTQTIYINYLSIPLRMKPMASLKEIIDELGFQFLWGWNAVEALNNGRSVVINFQFLWGWNHKEPEVLIADQMLQSFNSFEDETIVPTRYTELQPIYFQFLWGWNLFSVLRNIQKIFIFQFLWGWNPIDLSGGWRDFELSIPLRMKQN